MIVCELAYGEGGPWTWIAIGYELREGFVVLQGARGWHGGWEPTTTDTIIFPARRVNCLRDPKPHELEALNATLGEAA